jgi:hypothetical protein
MLLLLLLFEYFSSFNYLPIILYAVNIELISYKVQTREFEKEFLK